MKNALLKLLLGVGLLLGPTAFAEGYELADLKALVSSSDFKEALRHAKDIAPSKRSDEWKKLVSDSAVGLATQLQKKDCPSAWRFLEDITEEYAFLASDAALKKQLVPAGVCYLKENGYMERDDQDKLVKRLLEIDPAAIYAITLETRYYEYRYGYFLKFLEGNVAKYKNDPKVIEYLKDKAGNDYSGETPEITALKKKIAAAFGVDAIVAKELDAGLQKAADQVLKGEFDDQGLGWKAVRLAEAKSANAAIFLTAMVIVSSRDQEECLKALSKIPPALVKAADEKISKAKLSRSFWFGGGWSKEELAPVAKLFPAIVKVAKSECEAYRKDDSKDPAHVNTNACKAKADSTDGIF